MVPKHNRLLLVVCSGLFVCWLCLPGLVRSWPWTVKKEITESLSAKEALGGLFKYLGTSARFRGVWKIPQDEEQRRSFLQFLYGPYTGDQEVSPVYQEHLRKWNLGPDTRNCLVSNCPAEFAARFVVPAKSYISIPSAILMEYGRFDCFVDTQVVLVQALLEASNATKQGTRSPGLFSPKTPERPPGWIRTQLYNSGRWEEQIIDLRPWSGQEVELRIRLREEIPPTPPTRMVTEDGEVAPELPMSASVLGIGDPGIYLYGEKTTSERRKPNVLLIVWDTVRQDYLPWGGGKRNNAPQIQSMLVDQGTTFLNHFAQSPWTPPSHLSLFTSLHPHQHLFNPMFDPAQGPRFSRRLKTMAQIFRDQGYYTLAVANAFTLDPLYGFSQGFHRYENYEPIDDYSAYVVERLKELGDKPFFMFYHLYQAHAPYHKDDFVKAEKLDVNKHGSEAVERAKYASGIKWCDDSTAFVLRTIEELGQAENTLVILTSDHGEDLFERESFKERIDDHGHKLTDELLHIPLVMRGPGIPKGLKVEALTESIDILPTLLEMLQLKWPSSPIVGKSRVPLLNGKKQPEPLIQASALKPHYPQQFSLRTSREKYTIVTQDGTEKLYDLTRDPGETTVLDHADPRYEAMRSLFHREIFREGQYFSDSPGRPFLNNERLEALRNLGYVK